MSRTVAFDPGDRGHDDSQPDGTGRVPDAEQLAADYGDRQSVTDVELLRFGVVPTDRALLRAAQRFEFVSPAG